jgi:hypothetical protein
MASQYLKQNFKELKIEVVKFDTNVGGINPHL